MEDMIESVGLVIHTKDYRTKEIPLEVWQVGAVAEALGLQVRLPDLDDYQMSNREGYEKTRAEMHHAIRYYYGKIKEAIVKILSEYGIRTKKEFYEKTEEEAAEIYKSLEAVQEEFHLSKEDMEELVEDVL